MAGVCILVNYDEDVYRQIFTAAHEAAHGILDAADEVIVSFSRTYKEQDLIEIRANHFAARYLLPPDVLTGIPVGSWNRGAVVEWAGRLKVSTRALTIALKDAHLIDDETATDLASVSVPAALKVDPELANLSERGTVRKRELIERGLSSSYVTLCFEAFDRGLISGGRALVPSLKSPRVQDRSAAIKQSCSQRNEARLSLSVVRVFISFSGADHVQIVWLGEPNCVLLYRHRAHPMFARLVSADQSNNERRFRRREHRLAQLHAAVLDCAGKHQSSRAGHPAYLWKLKQHLRAVNEFKQSQ